MTPPTPWSLLLIVIKNAGEQIMGLYSAVTVIAKLFLTHAEIKASKH